jgi:hypothetical protein
MKFIIMLLGLSFSCFAVITGFFAGFIYKDSLLAANDFLILLSSSLFVLLLGVGLSFYGYKHQQNHEPADL